MAITIHRKGKTQGSIYAIPVDLTASKPILHSRDGQVRISWESGDGRRTNFLMTIDNSTLVQLIDHCVMQLVESRPKSAHDLTIPELLDIIKLKAAGEPTNKSDVKED